MNLNMIKPKNETEDFLLSITEICELLIKQIHRKAEETLEFKLSRSRHLFPFNPPISVEGSWMVGLSSLEVYNSIFNVAEVNNKFELYTDAFDDFVFEKLKNEIEEVLSISDITPHHLQQEVIGPRFIEAFKKLRSEKSNADGYIILLMGYARSPFRDFESYFRIVVGLDEDDIQLI